MIALSRSVGGVANLFRFLCSAEFCYECERPWKTCECPFFNPEQLLTRLDIEGPELLVNYNEVEVAAPPLVHVIIRRCLLFCVFGAICSFDFGDLFLPQISVIFVTVLCLLYALWHWGFPAIDDTM